MEWVVLVFFWLICIKFEILFVCFQLATLDLARDNLLELLRPYSAEAGDGLGVNREQVCDYYFFAFCFLFLFFFIIIIISSLLFIIVISKIVFSIIFKTAVGYG